MKHNFLNKQYFVGSPTEGGDSAIILKAIEGLTEKSAKQVEGVKNELTTAIENTGSQVKAIKDETDKLRESFNELSAKAATSFVGGASVKSFEGEIEQKLTENKEKLGKGVKFAIDFERKAVGNMGSTTNLTGSYLVPADTRAGIVLAQFEDVHMRNVLPVGRTASNVIRHVRDMGGEGGPGMVAEAATKPQMDRDLQIFDANVRKVATYLRVPEEMIEDIPYLTTFLTNIGTQEVLKFEDAQILYGDGTGQNLSGLFTNATAFADPGVVTSPNEFDVLRAARLQMRKAQRTPSAVMVAPLNYYLMTSRKDSTNNYILQGGGNGLIPNLDGVPIIENTAVTEGDFLMFDRNAAEIAFRAGLSIRFYEQDQDNAIKNMVTIVIEERLALPIYYTNGLVKGTFAAAIPALTT